MSFLFFFRLYIYTAGRTTPAAAAGRGQPDKPLLRQSFATTQGYPLVRLKIQQALTSHPFRHDSRRRDTDRACLDTRYSTLWYMGYRPVVEYGIP